MRDTESLHPLCWRGTYSYGKSLNVLILAVLDDLLQSVVVMWFSISHYDHDLFNAPPGTPGFSECLFPEGNTDQSEADQTQPRVGQHEKPYKNTSTPRSLAHPPPPRWPWTPLSEACGTVIPAAIFPQYHTWWGLTVLPLATYACTKRRRIPSLDAALQGCREWCQCGKECSCLPSEVKLGWWRPQTEE